MLEWLRVIYDTLLQLAKVSFVNVIVISSFLAYLLFQVLAPLVKKGYPKAKQLFKERKAIKHQLSVKLNLARTSNDGLETMGFTSRKITSTFSQKIGGLLTNSGRAYRVERLISLDLSTSFCQTRSETL